MCKKWTYRDPIFFFGMLSELYFDQLSEHAIETWMLLIISESNLRKTENWQWWQLCAFYFFFFFLFVFAFVFLFFSAKRKQRKPLFAVKYRIHENVADFHSFSCFLENYDICLNFSHQLLDTASLLIKTLFQSFDVRKKAMLVMSVHILFFSFL